jgi:hypothetical protein
MRGLKLAALRWQYIGVILDRQNEGNIIELGMRAPEAQILPDPTLAGLMASIFEMRTMSVTTVWARAARSAKN